MDHSVNFVSSDTDLASFMSEIKSLSSYQASFASELDFIRLVDVNYLLTFDFLLAYRHT